MGLKKMNYEDLKKHIGHKIVLICRGTEEERIEQNPESIALMCEDCEEELIEYKRED